MSGEPATLGINRYSVEHAVHSLIALLIITFSYYYIKHYLKSHHSVATVTAEFSPSKSMFTIKSVLVGIALTLTVLVIVVFLPKYNHSFPTGVLLTSVILILVEINFARKNVIKSFFMLQVKKRLTENYTFIQLSRGSQIRDAPQVQFKLEVVPPDHNFNAENSLEKNTRVAVFNNWPKFYAGSELQVTDTDKMLNNVSHDVTLREDSTNHPLFSASREDSTSLFLVSSSREDSTNKPLVSASRKNSVLHSRVSASRENSASLPLVSGSRKGFVNDHLSLAPIEDSNNHPEVFLSKEGFITHSPVSTLREEFTNHLLVFSPMKESTSQQESIDIHQAEPHRINSKKMPRVEK